MRSFMIVLATIYLAACGAEKTTDSAKKAETRYSKTLEHSRETASQLQQALDASAAKTDAIRKNGQ